MYYTFHCVFAHSTFHVSLSLPIAAKQMIHYCFCARPTVGQLNVQAAAAKNDKQYTLSNII